MVNTVTQRTLKGADGDSDIYRMVHIVSDGTEETDLVIYDNSAFVADTSLGNLMQVWACGDAGICRLEWDQTADSPAISVDAANGFHMDFRELGGVTNPGGAGATGDLVLSTADLDAGDEVTLFIHVSQI